MTATPQGPTLATGESIRINEPLIRSLDSGVASKAQRAGRGAALGAVGAVGGAALGSSMGGLFGMACGPAAIICVPVALAAGAGIGGAGGAVIGAGYGGTGGITGEKAERFNALAETVMDEARLAVELHDRTTEIAGHYWDVRADSDNFAALELTSLHFKQPGGEHIQLIAKASLRVMLSGRAKTLEIRHEGPGRHIDDWLDDDGVALATEVERAMSEVALSAVQRIAQQTRVAGR